MPTPWPERDLANPASGLIASKIGNTGGKDEEFLLRAFRSFSEAAGSLEQSYAMLRAEVDRLRGELEDVHAKLRREQALAEISTVLAHEIRNPLGSLELFAGLLAESDLNADCRSWVAQVQCALRMLAATVNNVLNFHSLPERERTAVDVPQLLAWTRDFALPLAHQSRITLSVQEGLSEIFITGDRHRMEQVLLNLVLNALRATPPGGWIELAGRKASQAVEIVVADTGCGISNQQLPHIFEPGFSTRSGSPGLGLAVCRKIVEQHGGTIMVESSESGTKFRLTFPLISRSAGAEE